MALSLQIILVLVCVIFLVLVFRLVAKGRLQLKYSLMWMLLALVLLICAIFPQIVFWASDLLGFDAPSNFIFFIGLFSLMLIALSLSMIVSWQARYIRSLVQTVALLEKKSRDGSNTDENNPSASFDIESKE